MDVTDLTLNCWVRSEDPRGFFRIQISGTKTVYDLQEAIKNEKSATFHNVDARALYLYKPTAPELSPYKDNLGKLILSDHAESLGALCKLSEIFPEPPPKRDIHVIVDAPSGIVCCLRGTTLDDSFRVLIHPGEDAVDLISRIRDEPNLRSVAHQPIRLYRISGDENELRVSLNKIGDGEPIQGALAISFLGVPVLDPLRVVIEVAAIGGDSPTLSQGHRDTLREYDDILLRVGRWDRFEESDIERNWIMEAREHHIPIPEFVTAFEQKLVRKPYFPSVRRWQDVEEYFEESIAGNESPEDIRYAEPSEVNHTGYVAHHKWENLWQPSRPHGHPLREHAACSIFFEALLINETNKMATALSDTTWPIDVVVKRDGDNELRKYRPKNKLLISSSTFPRLLVEVNSTLQYSWPMDLVRMLTTGAFLVRFANNFVSTFSQERNFVLCTFFIWDDGTAVRHTLFQIPNDKTVYFNMRDFSLTEPFGRVQFERHLYTVLGAKFPEDQNRAGWEAIDKLRIKIQNGNLKSMHIGSLTGQGQSRRVRTTNDGDDGSDGEGGEDLAQLRAHGYEVKPEVIIDASGGKWEPLSKNPDHIFTVYRPAEGIIAKKVGKGSNELEIFRLLDAIGLKSDHVISLIDSFDGWLILPKMVTIQDYVDFRNTRVFERKVSQVCLGVIKGVAYLHGYRIAHRDIKPDNVVVDKNFNSKIIDFDIAMRVKDEHEEVDDQCGTRGWMAHEVEEGLRHSPIKADRWACGQVVLFLLDEFCKEDGSLRAFATRLVSHDPNQRPSLLEWDISWVPPLSDAGNSDVRKALRLRRDRGVDGDGTETPPNVKRQRLESS